MAAHAYTALQQIIKHPLTAEQVKHMLHYSPVGDTFEYEDNGALFRICEEYGDAGVLPACKALLPRYRQMYYDLDFPADYNEWISRRYAPKEDK